MQPIRLSLLAILFLATILSSGCSVFIPIKHDPEIMCGKIDKGVVVVLPGIEGRSFLNSAICRGLQDGGVDWQVQLWDWTCSFNPLECQAMQGVNRKRAGEMASWIVQYRHDYPKRPIMLVGQSGGAAIAAWICEALPAGYDVDGIIMLAASLSPDYALSSALTRSRRGIVSFYSQKDWAVLGLGTTLAGTMDGAHGSSAGTKGFKMQHSRLFQIAWTPKMAENGHDGGHLSSGDEKFVSTYVAPLVLAPRWTPKVIGPIANSDLEAIKANVQAVRVASTAPAPKPAAVQTSTRPTRVASGAPPASPDANDRRPYPAGVAARSPGDPPDRTK